MKNPSKLIRLSAFLFAASAAQLAGAAPVAVTWTGLGTDMTWDNAGNWSGGTPPGNIVIFPAAMFPASTNGVGAVNNIVDANMTIVQLWYINTNALFGSTSNANYTTLINPGVSLTVNGNVYVGAQNSVGSTTVANMAGTNCSFIVSNLASTFGVGYTNNANNVQLVTFTLADGTNFINVGTLAVGNSVSGNGRQSILNLGNGTNIIYSPLIELGWGKAQGRIQFAGPDGGVLINGGTNGTRANIITGRGSSGTANVVGQLVLTNYANVLANVVSNGWGAAASSGGSPSGTIVIQDGIFDTTSLIMGANTGGTQSASGTFTIGGSDTTTATVVVNSPSGPGGGIFLLSDANNGTQTGTGTFNINTNGIANIYCSITMVQTADNTGTINLNGGTLTLEDVTNVIGSESIPINTMNLNGGTLNLSVDGNNSTTANITATSVTASETYGPNVINISSVANVLIPVTIHLINYANGSDPGLGNFTLGSYPSGYNAALQDNVNGDNSIDLVISTSFQINPVLWVGAVGGSVNNSWNYTLQNWKNLNNGNPTAYANPDLVTFDDSASSSTVNLTTNFTPGTLTFSNSVAFYTLTGSGSISGSVGLVMDGTAQVTLQETGGDNFTGGIAVNSGTVIFDNANSAIAGAVSIANGATLQIGNNDSHGNLPAANVSNNGTLIFDQTISSAVALPITGSGALTLNGNGTLTLSSGANAYNGNTTVNAGTLALTGSGTISNSQSVAVSGGTLDVSGISGVTLVNNLSLSSAVINVNTTNNPYLQPPIVVVSGSLMMSGAGNTINVTALPAIASYPSTLTLIAAPNGLSGFNMTLGTLPAGYSGHVTENSADNAVLLVLTSGPVGTRPYVVWSGANTINGVSTNWTDALNWQLPGAPLTTDTVIFDTNGQQTASVYSSPGGGANAWNPANVNNIVNTNFTLSTLIYTNIGSSGSASYQNTYITNGATLTVTNSMAVGSGSADYGSSAQENVTISGTNGTLTVINTNSTFLVDLVDPNSGAQAVLDMSGLGTFNATVGTFEVGGLPTTVNDVSGIAYLAQTNTIFAVAGSGGDNEGGQDEALSLQVGQSGKGASSEAYLYLGQKNVIHAYTIGIGIAKDLGEMQFNPIFSNPTVSIIGGDGVSPVQAWGIGDALAQTGGSTAPVGTADFTGGTVNALVSAMYIGRSPNAAGPHPATGTLTFGAGTFSVLGIIYNGFQAFNTTDNGVGTININGTGILNVGILNLAWTIGTTEASPTTGTLNITGGSVLAGTIAADTNNVGQSSISLNGGLLAVTNTAGSPASPLTTLTLSGGTLQLMNVNGALTSTNIVATTINASGTTTVNIGSIVNGLGNLQIPIISYTGADPYSSLTLGTIPAGSANASLVDDTANSTIDLKVTVTINPNPPKITTSVSDGVLTISWPADNTGWILQAETNSVNTGLRTNSADWFTVPGSTTVNSVQIPMDTKQGTVFYRMVLP